MRELCNVELVKNENSNIKVDFGRDEDEVEAIKRDNHMVDKI